MGYLLDTHTVLWILDEEEKLSSAAEQALRDTSKEAYVSIASAWELAIKIGTGKLAFNGGVERFFHMIDENDFGVLPIKREHLQALGSFPPLHKDPFDRLLISTALVDNLTLITADENVQKYDVPWIW